MTTTPVGTAAATDASLGGVGREGLLAQHVLARGERGHRPSAVESVGQRVVDGVDVGVVDELLVGADHAGDAVLGGEGRRPARGRGRRSPTTSAPATCRAGRIRADGRDPRRAEDTDADGRHRCRLQPGRVRTRGDHRGQVDLGLPLPCESDHAQDRAGLEDPGEDRTVLGARARGRPRARAGGGPARASSRRAGPTRLWPAGRAPWRPRRAGCRSSPVGRPRGTSLPATQVHTGTSWTGPARSSVVNPERGGGSSSGRTWGWRLTQPSWAAASSSMARDHRRGVLHAELDEPRLRRRVTRRPKPSRPSARATQGGPVEAVDGGEVLDGLARQPARLVHGPARAPPAPRRPCDRVCRRRRGPRPRAGPPSWS